MLSELLITFLELIFGLKGIIIDTAGKWGVCPITLLAAPAINVFMVGRFKKYNIFSYYGKRLLLPTEKSALLQSWDVIWLGW
jgi:hypothetical protein